MSLARWDPLLQLTNLENELNQLLRRQFTGGQSGEGALSSAQFAPPVDVYEDDNRVSFRVELPGINPNDVDVRIDGHTLTISGERKFEKEEKKENFRHVERAYGSFSRSFALPGSADPDSIKAAFNDGVLQVDVPKRAEARGKQIKIGTGKSTTEQRPKAA